MKGSVASGRNHGGRRDDPHVQLSKLLTKILRHKASDYRIPMRPDGYVNLKDLFRHQSMRNYSVADLYAVVSNCSKQRFALRMEGGEEFIRAQQGHSISSVVDEELLERVLPSEGPQYCYHGTYSDRINDIKTTGLCRMARNHVHLTPALPGDESIISGMRQSADVIVVVDMRAAMQDGIPFFRSGNNVLLTPGIGDTGIIPPAYLVDFIYKDNKKRPAHEVAESPLPLYYCVIDFEATCIENGKILNQEIIEFPAVLVNACTMEQEFEFHSYVRPTHNPVLTDFCTSLTGISQQTVDAAPVFREVYDRFKDFMTGHGFDIEHNWTQTTAHSGDVPIRRAVQFVSYGDFEYRTIFPNQCRLVGMHAPLVALQSWINVKVLFTRNFRKAKKRGTISAPSLKKSSVTLTEFM